MTEPLPIPDVNDPSLQEQVKRSQQNVKAFRFIGEKIVEHREKDYQPNVLRFAGQIDAFQETIAKIQGHIAGIRTMHLEGDLTEAEYKVALKWSNEILGIPVSLSETANINFRRAEGAVLSSNEHLEDINVALRAEQANIRRLESVGVHVDELNQRKADAALAKDSEPQAQPGASPEPNPVAETPLVTSPLQTTA